MPLLTTTHRQCVYTLVPTPTPYREAIKLVDLEGFTYREASRVLGIPMGTVMSRLSRGRIRLRGLFEATPSVDKQAMIEAERSRSTSRAEGATA